VRSGEADVRAHFGPPLRIHALYWLPYKNLSFFIGPQAWFGLKACRGCGDIAIPVLAPTSGRDRVTHGTRLPTPPPGPTLQQQTFMHAQLESWEAAGLEQVEESAIFLPKRCKKCQNGQWHAHHALTSHLFTLPDSLQHRYMVMHICWGSRWGKHGGRKANWPRLGGQMVGSTRQ